MRVSILLFVLFASPAVLEAAKARETVHLHANPIRKVVKMLQAMQKKVTEEGEAEQALHDKFQCYCQSNGGSLDKGIADAEEKITALTAEIKASAEKKAQVSEDLKQAQEDRDAAKAAVAEASAIREKEAAAFAAMKAEAGPNVAAINKAVDALEKGMAGAFLQTGAAQALRAVVSSKRTSLIDEDRQTLLSFLHGSQGAKYSPQSGEITGILKQMSEEMAKGLAEATESEEAAIETYDKLMAAKKKELGALTASIEAKLTTSGELGVALQQMKNDKVDTEESLVADKEFKANLERSCATKKGEFEQRVKTRAEELTALADTIKVLNDDDALELFKKTLPSSSASFMQVKVTAAALRSRALAMLRDATGQRRADRTRLDLVMLALHGKKVGFEKVIGMIDGMVQTLKTEQKDDDDKKDYCGKQFDLSDDKKKSQERAIADEETAIANAKEGLETVAEEIAKLKVSISALDKSVTEATAQRKQEHQEYKDLMASNSAAKELLSFAKNRLNKFYNPKLYKPAAKRELSAEDRIVENYGGSVTFAQVSSHSYLRGAPKPPPDTVGAYTQKSEGSTGVIAMINLLIGDLEKEMTEAETEEKDAQADYEAMMSDSSEKRRADAKTLTGSEATKAELQTDLESHIETKKSGTKELAETVKFIHSLHGECDWLLQYFSARKEARAGEIDALGKAKAVLSGADYSFMQQTMISKFSSAF